MIDQLKPEHLLQLQLVGEREARSRAEIDAANSRLEVCALIRQGIGALYQLGPGDEVHPDGSVKRAAREAPPPPPSQRGG